MVIFEKLEIEGFGCYSKKTFFVLNNPGLNIILGKNGSGKSTIFSALTWVIYGKSLKAKSEIETWEHKRTKPWNGTKVELSFNKDNTNYKIIRFKDYKLKVLGGIGKNRLLLLKDGELISSTKDKRELQLLIESIIGYSYTLFINTILFPQKARRFIEENGVDKKAILEEIFSLDWITKALEIAKEEKNILTLELVKLNSNLATINSKIASQKEFINHVKQSKQEFELTKQKNIKEIEEAISRETMISKEVKDTLPLEIKLQELKEYLSSLEKKEELILYDKNYKDNLRISAEIQTTKVSLAKLQDRINYYKGKDSLICDTCGQTITDNKALEILGKLEKDHLELANKLTKLIHTYNNYKSILEIGGSLRKEFKEKKEELDNISIELTEINHYKDKLKDNQNLINILKENLAKEKDKEFIDIIPELNRKLDQELVKLPFIEKDIIRLERELATISWIIAKPLSNAGIKSFIISKLIKQLNYRLTYYEKFTNFGIELLIDEDLSRKDLKAIITKDGYPVIFEDISGGESQLVNISIAFAMNDLVATTNKTNLTIFDELFESLDLKNVEVVADLLQDRVNNGLSIFIITHKLDFSPRNANVIKIDDYDQD